MAARADTTKICRQVLCLYWPLTARGVPGSQRGHGLAGGAQKVKALSAVENNIKVSEPHILTATCWFRACFLIRGWETPGLSSSKEKARLG